MKALSALEAEQSTITNLCFADDIDGLAGKVEELAKLVERLNKASTAYGIWHGDQCREDQADDKQHQWH